MPTDQRLRRNLKTIGPASFALISLIAADPSAAEIKIITATGEYRMGDNDTRTDAKRLALLDAKRLALEQAGTYIESLTEVKNYSLSNDEVQAYTAGIVEVTELTTKDAMDGATHIVRVQAIAKIDMDVVWRQIDALRNDEIAKAELLRLRAERNQFKKELDSKTQELAVLKSKTEVEVATKQRQETLTALEIEDMLAQAWQIYWSSRNSAEGLSPSATHGHAVALKLILKALNLNSSHPNAYAMQGIILEDQGDNKGAVRAFRTAIALTPNNELFHRLLGFALVRGGDLASAVMAFRTGIKLEPNEAQAHHALALTLIKLGNWTEGIEECRKAVRLDSQNAQLRLTLGQALADRGDIVGALAELNTALVLQPENAETHVSLGYALDRKGDREGAIREFRKAERLQPENPEVADLLAGALFTRIEDWNGAINQWRKVVRKRPDHFKARLFLAIALMQVRDKGGAAQEFRKFLDVVPRTPENQKDINFAQDYLRDFGQ